VDARPVLVAAACALREVDLEAVLIGNAGAAIQGAPVTTVDLDFLFRKTPRNLPTACNWTSWQRCTASDRSKECGIAHA